jgi:hypothetical protein
MLSSRNNFTATNPIRRLYADFGIPFSTATMTIHDSGQSLGVSVYSWLGMLFAHLRIDSRATAGKDRLRRNKATRSIRIASFWTIEAVTTETIANKNFSTPFAAVRARSDDIPKAAMARKQKHQNADNFRQDCTEADRLAQFILEEWFGNCRCPYLGAVLYNGAVLLDSSAARKSA